jgi:hypothetical protein
MDLDEFEYALDKICSFCKVNQTQHAVERNIEKLSRRYRDVESRARIHAMFRQVDPQSLITDVDYDRFGKAAAAAAKLAIKTNTSQATGVPNARPTDPGSTPKSRERSKSAHKGGAFGRHYLAESKNEDDLAREARLAEKLAKKAEANAVKLIAIFSSWNGAGDQGIDDAENLTENKVERATMWKGLGIETVASFLLQVIVAG